MGSASSSPAGGRYRCPAASYSGYCLEPGVSSSPGAASRPSTPDRRRVAQHHGHQVQRVRMVLDDVGATVHDPVEEIADCPIRNRGAELLVAVVVAAHGPPVESHVVRGDRLADAVGFRQRRAQPLLRIDSPDPVLRAEDDRRGAVYRRGGHAYDVRLFGLDHFAIIEVRIRDAEPSLEALQAFLAAIWRRRRLPSPRWTGRR